MKNIIRFALVFALAAGLAACSKNAKKAPAADAAAVAAAPQDEIVEIEAEETDIAVEDEGAYGVSTVSSDKLAPVNFAFNEYTLSKATMKVLEENAKAIKARKIGKIVVEGNCDDRGTIAYNIVLGDKRAKEVKDYYVKLGVAAKDITTVSYGEEKPVCFEQTEACWAKNRRAETVIK